MAAIFPLAVPSLAQRNLELRIDSSLRLEAASEATVVKILR